MPTHLMPCYQKHISNVSQLYFIYSVSQLQVSTEWKPPLLGAYRKLLFHIGKSKYMSDMFFKGLAEK